MRKEHEDLANQDTTVNVANGALIRTWPCRKRRSRLRVLQHSLVSDAHGGMLPAHHCCVPMHQFLLPSTLCLIAGQTEPAAVQHGSWMAAWRRFGWLPELFDISIATRHPLEKVGLAKIRAAAGCGLDSVTRRAPLALAAGAASCTATVPRLSS